MAAVRIRMIDFLVGALFHLHPRVPGNGQDRRALRLLIQRHEEQRIAAPRIVRTRIDAHHHDFLRIGRRQYIRRFGAVSTFPARYRPPRARANPNCQQNYGGQNKKPLLPFPLPALSPHPRFPLSDCMSFKHLARLCPIKISIAKKNFRRNANGSPKRAAKTRDAMKKAATFRDGCLFQRYRSVS